MIHQYFSLSLIVTLLSIQATVAQDLLPIRQNGKWGFIDINGDIIVDAIYEHVSPFEKGYAYVEKSNQVGLVDTDGKEIVPCSFQLVDPLTEDLVATLEQDKTWSIYSIQQQAIVAKNVPSKLESIDDTYFYYETPDGLGIFHLDKGKLTEAKYNVIDTSEYEGWFYVENEEGFEGLVDSLGNEILEPKFNYVSLYDYGILTREEDNRWML